MESIYFEAQTGIIREQRGRSNFYQYQLSPNDRTILEAAVSKATPGCGGLEYEATDFLHTLDAMEQKHRRELVRANR